MQQHYETVIGLEVHAELCTKSKIFCGCENAFGGQPNTRCCPVCMGLPGALPVLNRQVVEDAVLMGHALHCHINRVSHMDRKNYFYPDLPKAYQISQYDTPLGAGGWVDILVGEKTKRVGITRIHIEEDAGKLLHDARQDGTLIDFNRCGVPLVEIVCAPDLRSAAEAKAYLETIAAILRYLGISDARMQEGSIRADINVSVRPCGQTALGARTEIKNVNSFGAVYRAVRQETQRQIALLRAGGAVQQQTLRWDEGRGECLPMRGKESAQDYRYFPEPDLPSFAISEQRVSQLRAQLPELPVARTLRFCQQFGLSLEVARQLCADKACADFYDAAVALRPESCRALAHWLLGEVTAYLNTHRLSLVQTALTPEALCRLTALVEEGTLSNTAAKTVLTVLLRDGGDPADLAGTLHLTQCSDEQALQAIVEQTLAANPQAVSDWRRGRANAVQYLMGQCMRASKGQASPAVLQKLMLAALQEQG